MIANIIIKSNFQTKLIKKLIIYSRRMSLTPWSFKKIERKIDVLHKKNLRFMRRLRFTKSVKMQINDTINIQKTTLALA